MSDFTTSCTRKIEFDAAHRVMEHESKCRMLHGHRYVIEATFEAQALDVIGRVVDFGVIKQKLGAWIDDNWDHNTILHTKDELLGKHIQQVTAQPVFYLPNNPTAENMAAYLLKEICPVLFKEAGLQCVKIKLWETPNCYAEVYSHST